MKSRNVYPSREQFEELWKNYSVIPFVLRFKEEIPDIYPFYLSSTQKLKESFLLDGSGRYSFFPLKRPIEHYAASTFQEAKRIWKLLREKLEHSIGPKLPSGYPPFYGGAVGVLSYDAGRIFETGWKSSPPPDPLHLPLIDFYIYDDLLCYDSKNEELFVVSCLINKKKDTNRKSLYNQQLEKLLRYERIFNETDPTHLYERSGTCLGHMRASKNEMGPLHKKYIQSIHQIKNYISQGDIYQANLSQRLGWSSNLSIEQFFDNLRKVNPSPYSCLWKTPTYSIASCSPELLLKKRGNRLETRPIAGTRPRGENQRLDQTLEGELLLNEKERAEHIMLVDLERNDLGKVCTPGSVHVPKSMTVEKYSHVMHIVSHVEGQIIKSLHFFDALESLFPGGTITGCPKIRCMEILDELEPVRRTLFYGSLGWIGFQGDGEMNILIRTSVVQKDRFTIQVGSGIVADSLPEREFDESIFKARALLLARIDRN